MISTYQKLYRLQVNRPTKKRNIQLSILKNIISPLSVFKEENGVGIISELCRHLKEDLGYDKMISDIVSFGSQLQDSKSITERAEKRYGKELIKTLIHTCQQLKNQ